VRTEVKPPGATSIIEQHRFQTRFRPSRSYWFEFREDQAAGGDIIAIWCDGGDYFETWWSTTRVHERYGRGQGSNAFALTAYPTMSTALLLAPSLFPGAGLVSPLGKLESVSLAEPTTFEGQPAVVIRANSRIGYQTGQGARLRPIEITLDAQTMLVRQIVQDTPPGAPAGSIDQIEVTFDFQANPVLGSSDFSYEIPSEQGND
ncbi:MAG: hypothetical protein O3A63_18370, partial [Proteobacteria bacterium]|nr:hypothetical protein [Pseudomonadota bacterium]